MANVIGCAASFQASSCGLRGPGRYRKRSNSWTVGGNLFMARLEVNRFYILPIEDGTLIRKVFLAPSVISLRLCVKYMGKLRISRAAWLCLTKKPGARSVSHRLTAGCCGKATEPEPPGNPHRPKSAFQLVTTVIGVVAVSSRGVIIKNRWPSPETS
jgi:hypothetical protein